MVPGHFDVQKHNRTYSLTLAKSFCVALKRNISSTLIVSKENHFLKHVDKEKPFIFSSFLVHDDATSVNLLLHIEY